MAGITRQRLKELVKEVMVEETEYQQFFQKALDKAGKSIPSMSDEEKKAFFDKIDTAWNGKGEKNEALVGGQKELDVDGDGEIEGSDLADLRAGKKADENINEGRYDADLDKIEAAVKNATSFMNVGAELKKAGIKYDFTTSMIPMYMIKVSGNTIAICNKKYAAGAEREVKDMAIGLLESKLNEGIWPKSKLASPFQMQLSLELKKKFKGVFYSVGYDLYHNNKKVLTIDGDDDSINSVIAKLKKIIK